MMLFLEDELNDLDQLGSWLESVEIVSERPRGRELEDRSDGHQRLLETGAVPPSLQTQEPETETTDPDRAPSDDFVLPDGGRHFGLGAHQIGNPRDAVKAAQHKHVLEDAVPHEILKRHEIIRMKPGRVDLRLAGEIDQGQIEGSRSSRSALEQRFDLF